MSPLFDAEPAGQQPGKPGSADGPGPQGVTITENRAGRLVQLAIGYALLAFPVGWHLLSGGPLQWSVVALAVVAAGWLPLASRPAAVWASSAHYAGILAVGTTLTSLDQVFAVFLAVGYPLAFFLFRPKVSVWAVALVSVLSLAAQNGAFRGNTGPSGLDWSTVALGLAGPLLLAGWYLGAESEQHRRTSTALAEANDRLRTTLADNAELQRQLLAQAHRDGMTQERQRLAWEMHDTVAQDLTALVTQLHAVDLANDPDHHLRLAHQMTRRALTETRRAVQALRPPALAAADLPRALQELVAGWRGEEPTRPALTLTVTGDPVTLPAEVETALLRAAQEALANTARHAAAGRAGVTLSYLTDLVLLDVRDDGIGFTPGTGRDQADGSGYGLVAMAERLARIGGRLRVEAAPGEGTAIAVSVPLPPPERSGERGERPGT